MHGLILAILIVAALTACDQSPMKWRTIDWESTDYGVSQHEADAPSNDR